MAQNTRSKSNQSLSEMSPAEVESMHSLILQKERQIRDQAEALAAQKAEFDKQVETHRRERENEERSGREDLLSLFNDLRNEIREQMHTTQGQTAQAAAFTETPAAINRSSPLRRESPSAFQEQSPFRLKDVADSIPRFDGHRMSVFHFSQACERALSLIPAHQERYLVPLLMSRLHGDAYAVASGSEYTCVETLLRKLKRVFGPNKSINQYKGELGNAYMKPNETIFDFVSRIKELQAAILDCEIENGNANAYTRASIEEDVFESFVNGLPPDMALRLRVEGFDTLECAIEKSIQISKRIEIEKLRQKPTFVQPPAKLPRRDVPPVQQHGYPDSRPVQIAQRPNAPFIKPLVPGQSGPNAPSQIVCYGCRQPGHVISRCPEKVPSQPRVQFAATRGNNDNRIERPGNETRVPIPSSAQRDTNVTGRSVRIIEATEPTDPITNQEAPL